MYILLQLWRFLLLKKLSMLLLLEATTWLIFIDNIIMVKICLFLNILYRNRCEDILPSVTYNVNFMCLTFSGLMTLDMSVDTWIRDREPSNYTVVTIMYKTWWCEPTRCFCVTGSQGRREMLAVRGCSRHRHRLMRYVYQGWPNQQHLVWKK